MMIATSRKRVRKRPNSNSRSDPELDLNLWSASRHSRQSNLALAGSVRYDGGMSKAAAQIEQQFKKLAPKDQAELFDRLGSVVYEETGENVELIRTLKRRVHEIESGAVKGRDAFEVLDELKARHSR